MAEEGEPEERGGLAAECNAADAERVAEAARRAGVLGRRTTDATEERKMSVLIPETTYNCRAAGKCVLNPRSPVTG